jgi:nitric oxide dioxygenase
MAQEFTQETSLPHPGPLTDAQRKLIKATVPVLTQRGGEITRLFYESMLEAQPDLNNIFSHSKQMTGHQADALANSILAYADNIDDLTPILPVVERICNKHASLHILPEHYTIVGTYLLRTITDVLGADVFKGELYDAWFAGYWQLAHILIDREAALYKQAGWVGWKEFVVAKRVQESEDITSLYFEPKEPLLLSAYRPGQYISVRRFVPKLDRYQSRQYSLSDTPTPDHFRISVKREAGIRATRPGSDTPDTTHAAHPGWISNLLHDTLHEGDTVELAHPFGDFFLDASPAPIVLISAGVGLTPLLAILNTLVKPTEAPTPKRQVSWIQVVHGPQNHAFKAHVARLHAVNPSQLATAVFYSHPEGAAAGQDYDFAGRMDLAKVEPKMLHLDDPATDYYTCGPESFMAGMAKELKARGVDSKRIHAEVFGAGSLPL